MTEVKLQEGEQLTEFELIGYTQHAFLRVEHAEGGTIVYTRNDAGLNLEVWNTLSSPERVWIKVETDTQRFAICNVYLRTNKGKDHSHYTENKKLLETIQNEAELIQTQGTGILLLGDFNAHVGNESVLGFMAHTHPVNNNGNLLIQFCKELKLTCLNSIRWAQQTPDQPTFRRHYSHGLVKSILDYGLVSSAFLKDIQTFQVHTDKGLELDSDHATLYVELIVGRTMPPSSKKKANLLRYIKKWDVYKNIMEQRLNKQSNFKQLGVSEQERWLKKQMNIAGHSSTVRNNMAKTKKFKTSLELDRLNAKVRLSRRNYFSGTNQRTEEENLQARKQWETLKEEFTSKHFIHQIQMKRKTRALLRAKGPKSRKLFWNLVGGSKVRKRGIDALEENKKLVTDTMGKNEIIEKFFAKKFKAALIPQIPTTETKMIFQIGLEHQGKYYQKKTQSQLEKQ